MKTDRRKALISHADGHVGIRDHSALSESEFRPSVDLQTPCDLMAMELRRLPLGLLEDILSIPDSSELKQEGRAVLMVEKMERRATV